MIATTDFSALEESTVVLNDRTHKILNQLHPERTKTFEMITDSALILVATFKLRQQMVCLNKKIGQMVVETDEDRSLCNGASQKMLDLLREIKEVREKSVSMIFLSIARRLLDDTARLMEDASETLSLAASLEFKELLDRTLVVNENP